jgi:hypothetical protein
MVTTKSTAVCCMYIMQEPPHTNMAGDMSAERRGPHVEVRDGWLVCKHVSKEA